MAVTSLGLRGGDRGSVAPDGLIYRQVFTIRPAVPDVAGSRYVTISVKVNLSQHRVSIWPWSAAPRSIFQWPRAVRHSQHANRCHGTERGFCLHLVLGCFVILGARRNGICIRRCRIPRPRLLFLFQLVILTVLPDVPDIARRSYVALFIEAYPA